MEKMPANYVSVSEYLFPSPIPIILRSQSVPDIRDTKTRKNRTARDADESIQQDFSTAIKQDFSTTIRQDFSTAIKQLKRGYIKTLAKKLSKLFNKMKVMHNDAHLENLYVNRQGNEMYIIDFGRAEMGLKDEPVLYPLTANSLPSFKPKSLKDLTSEIEYKEAVDNFISRGDMTFVTTRRLGGKRRSRKLMIRRRHHTRKSRSR
jgi:serine/threonine protein kinase